MIAVRVLGSLMEKQVTTPDNYPLTLNALVAACNQTSNRDPVLSIDAAAASEALKELSAKSLVREVYRNDSRAKRYRHLMEESTKLHLAEIAALCVLMLRGAQTVGEIRGRTTRMFEFVDLAHVEVTLQALMTLPTPLVAEVPRGPGQKETRYAHLLSGEPETPTGVAVVMDRSRLAASSVFPAKPDRLDALEQAVESLRAEMAEMQTRFDEFRREFQ